MTTPDPLDGIPEPERSRIVEAAELAEATAIGLCSKRMGYGFGGPPMPEPLRLKAVAAGAEPRAKAIAAGVAAYHARPTPSPGFVRGPDGASVLDEEGQRRAAARSAPETLTREEADARLRALGHHPHMVDEFLHDAQEHLDNNSYLRPGTYDVLRAYVRHLDKVPAPEPIVALRAALAGVPGGVWSWEEHGKGWALYVNRGEPIDRDYPQAGTQHGYNILNGDFDGNGEALRAFVLAAHSQVPKVLDGIEAERKAWARLVRAEGQCGDGQEMPVGYAAALDAAKQALRDLGVDVDALLEAT